MSASPQHAGAGPVFDPYLQAIERFSAGRWSDCRRLLDRLPTDQSERVEVLQLRALAALQDHCTDEAEDCFRRLLRLQADHADACFHIGLLAEAGGMTEAAEAAFRRSLALRPEYLEARYRLGQLLHRNGRLGEAEPAYREVIRQRPRSAEVHVLLGGLLRNGGRRQEAEEILLRARRLELPTAELRYRLAAELERNGCVEEAEDEYRRALELKPDLLEHLINLAGRLKEARRLPEAETIYRQILRMRPEFAPAHNNLGLLAMEAERAAEAEADFRRALFYRPDFTEAIHNLSCLLLKGKRRLAEASDLCEQALRLDPGHAAAFNQRGILALEAGRLADAENDFRQARQIAPENCDAAWNLGIVQLLQGNMKAGWAGYEFRWKAALSAHRRDFEQPLWDGRPFPGETLLIYCEQGLGDSIQFVRYLPAVAGRGGKLILECPAELVRLFAEVPGIDRIIPQGTQLPPFDRQCPLLSLPGRLGTERRSLPLTTPYLAAPAQSRSTVPTLAAAAEAALKVGLVWAGNPHHNNDLNRSIDFSMLSPLLDLPGITWVVLQRERRPADFETLAARRGWLDPWAGAADGLADFADTAAVIEQLDLVIGVDTALIHLAGALGKPTWALIPYNPDWRWRGESENSAWYPTLRLFRQPRRDSWPDVIERITKELAALAGSGAETAVVVDAAPDLPPPPAPSPEFAVPRLPPDRRMVAARHGVFLYDSADGCIGHALETCGEYGEHQVALLLQLLRPGDTVVEARANIGVFTLPMAKAVGPAGLVLAVESNPVVFHTLNANLALNALENVRSYPYAVGLSPGSAEVPPLNFAGPGTSGFSRIADRHPVPLIRLDDLCRDVTPRLIKIGMGVSETDILLGAAELISRARPLLYVENGRPPQGAEIRLLRRMGYRLYWHTPPLFNPNNYFRLADDPYGGEIIVNMLCIPAGSSLRVRGLPEVGADNGLPRIGREHFAGDVRPSHEHPARIGAT